MHAGIVSGVDPMRINSRLVSVVALSLLATVLGDGPADDQGLRSRSSQAAEGPPARRELGGDDAERVTALNMTIDQLWGEGKFAEAVGPAQEVLEICRKALGPDHWQAADARREVEDLRRIA